MAEKKLKLTPEEQITVRSYDRSAAEWASKHSAGRFWGYEMDRFNVLIPPGSQILEIGSGGGRDAKELVEMGYKYVGVDVSEGLLNEARRLNPGVTFLRRAVYDLGFHANQFDGFWTSATLLHIPKKRLDAALSEIFRVVKPSGIGFISIKKGKGEKIEDNDPEMAKKPRLFSYYSDEEFQTILKRNGFEVLHATQKPMSERTTWLIYFVRVKK
ncbi:class I SAM-dependent methyltransferase [Candidatus Woesebacteria bacterium]|nr:class I SAM-dependent methyltransferase [Candidatus Woesebacteria bacterium]